MLLSLRYLIPSPLISYVFLITTGLLFVYLSMIINVIFFIIFVQFRSAVRYAQRLISGSGAAVLEVQRRIQTVRELLSITLLLSDIASTDELKLPSS